MIRIVVRFGDDNVIVLDERGEQIPSLQGRYREVKDKILADAPPDAKFYLSGWPLYGTNVPREQW